jgi:hypothetical protein
MERTRLSLRRRLDRIDRRTGTIGLRRSPRVRRSDDRRRKPRLTLSRRSATHARPPGRRSGTGQARPRSRPAHRASGRGRRPAVDRRTRAGAAPARGRDGARSWRPQACPRNRGRWPARDPQPTQPAARCGEQETPTDSKLATNINARTDPDFRLESPKPVVTARCDRPGLQRLHLLTRRRRIQTPRRRRPLPRPWRPSSATRRWSTRRSKPSATVDTITFVSQNVTHRVLGWVVGQ